MIGNVTMKQKFDWTHKSLSRRTVLKGVGVTLGLPFLEAMWPASKVMAGDASVASKVFPTRLAWVYFPNGVVQDNWAPTGAGREFSLNDTTSALESVRDDVTLITNLRVDKAFANGDGAGDHARCGAVYLTQSQPKKTGGKDVYLGTSVDQVAARAVGGQTRLASLELGTERGEESGQCDSGYSCVYINNISWRSPTQPMPKETDPRRAFERLFGGAANDPQTARRLESRQSILDFVSGSASSLKSQLGSSDRAKMEEYFQSVRDVEQRIERFSTMPAIDVPAEYLPPEDPGSHENRLRLMYDLIAIAFQTDATRIATYMLANAQTNRVYRNLGVSEGHHQLTHSTNREEEIRKIDRFLLAEFVRFVEKMKSIPEGDGTLLDHSIICYGSGMDDGRKHGHANVPCVVAGKGNGAVTNGVVLQAANETPMANLFLSMLNATGANVERFGDSTGMLAGLKS